jgi:hypothetical protein
MRRGIAALERDAGLRDPGLRDLERSGFRFDRRRDRFAPSLH